MPSVESTRKLKSYDMWKSIGSAFKDAGFAEGMVMVYTELDFARAFGTETMSKGAWRSLLQFLIDQGIAQNEVIRIMDAAYETVRKRKYGQ